MNKTVFVVDDDQRVRRSTELMLASAGYDVMSFGSGAEFLESADPSAPACAIFDVRMPDIDGLKLLEIVQSRGWKLPVIVASGHTDVNLGVQALAAGAFDVAEKPYTEAAIFDAIDRALASVTPRNDR